MERVVSGKIKNIVRIGETSTITVRAKSGEQHRLHFNPHNITYTPRVGERVTIEFEGDRLTAIYPVRPEESVMGFDKSEFYLMLPFVIFYIMDFASVVAIPSYMAFFWLYPDVIGLICALIFLVVESEAKKAAIGLVLGLTGMNGMYTMMYLPIGISLVYTAYGFVLLILGFYIMYQRRNEFS
jgi:hypothetical protein